MSKTTCLYWNGVVDAGLPEIVELCSETVDCCSDLNEHSDGIWVILSIHKITIKLKKTWK